MFDVMRGKCKCSSYWKLSPWLELPVLTFEPYTGGRSLA